MTVRFNVSGLRGRSSSYHDPDSHSGYNVTRYQLVQMGETNGFFSQVVQAGWHQKSIKRVVERTVDASQNIRLSERGKMKSESFEHFAGISAIAAGIVGIVYSFSFVVLIVGGKAPALGLLLSSLFLMLGGLLSSVAIVAVFNRVSEAEPALGIWGLMLALIGQLGAVIHGGYDLANAIHSPASNVPSLSDLPSQIDPRGLLTFGLAGLGLLVLALLIQRSDDLPMGLGTLGYLLAGLLVVIYLGRLIILSPTNPVVAVLILVTGFIVNPAWYIWLGTALLRRQDAKD